MSFEDLQSKIEDLEMAFEVSEELLMEKLSKFEIRLCAIENVHKSDVEGLRTELEQLSRSKLTSSGLSNDPPCGSISANGTEESSAKSMSKPVFQVPMALKDVRDNVKDLIQDYLPVSVDVKEKLTPVQCAFVTYWVNNRKPVSAKKSTAITLREDGIAADMWNPDWKPDDITGDLESYLQEKIKLVLKKQKKNAMKTGMKR